jgi:Rod binding domain-containing protein
MISPVVLMGASTAQNEALKQAHSAKPDGGFRALYEQESRTQDLASSAKQFEALILGQILKSAQSSAQMAAIDGVADSSSGTMLEMAQECFAQAIAARGGLGIAKLVESSMARKK